MTAPFRDEVEYKFFLGLAAKMQDRSFFAVVDGFRWDYRIAEEFYYDGAMHFISMTKREIFYCGGGMPWAQRYETNPKLVLRLLRMTTGRE